MRSAILIRRSKDDRTDEPEEVMLNVCLKYVHNKGFACDPKADVFIDVGETGGTVLNNGEIELPTQRPAVRKLLKRLTDYQAVCVYKYDRLSRDQFTFGLLPYVFLNNGVQVLSPIDGDLDPSKAGNKLMFQLQGYKADAERQDIRQRSMDALSKMIQDGKNPGRGRAKYGYNWERLGPGKRAGRRLIINPETMPIVERIFNEVASGRSLWAVANGLSLDKIGSPAGKPFWRRETIRIIIQDVIYKGDPATLNKTLCKGIKVRSKNGKTYTPVVFVEGMPAKEPTPAIVSVKLWNKAQTALSKWHKEFDHRITLETWVRGLVLCGHCKSPMQFTRREGNWILECPAQTWKARCPVRARLDIVEEYCWSLIMLSLNNQDLLKNSLLLGTEDSTLDQLKTTLDTLNHEYAQLEARKVKLLDRIEDEEDKELRKDWSSRASQVNGEMIVNRRTADAIARKLQVADERRQEAGSNSSTGMVDDGAA